MRQTGGRIGIGIVAGLVSSTLLAATMTNEILTILLGALVGASFPFAFQLQERTYFENLTAGAGYGLLAWSVLSVILVPLVQGDGAKWQANEITELFPELVGWMLFGAALGFIARLLNDQALPRIIAQQAPADELDRSMTRIVILGGGFGGMKTAQKLEQHFDFDPSISITLISDTNSFLFKPMLAEVAASSLEPTHISHPLRTALHRTNVIRGTVTDLDPDRQIVQLERAFSGGLHEEPYDHVILALGAATNFRGRDNVKARALEFRSLGDAIGIRNQIIEMFERADQEQDPDQRRKLLTFVIAGGGFAGAELSGALNDFTRGMLRYYHNVPREELSVIVVHQSDHILSELGKTLGKYALDRLEERGVTFMLGSQITDACADEVILDSGKTIATETLIWVAGTRPNPLVRSFPLTCNRRGAVIVDETMAVPDAKGIWALGDCGAVPNAATDKSCPPTAQFAERQAVVLANNIHATVTGKPTRPFQYEEKGVFCILGHHTACADIFGRQFSGLFAWLLWRGVYLGKLPGLERKVRVLSDWLVELFFPRDIVQTIDLNEERT